MDSSKSDERELLLDAARGVESAFEKLYARYGPRLRLIAWRLCRRDDVAEDLAHEAWCRAYRIRTDYDPDRPFLTWIAGILQNVWREHARRESARRAAAADQISQSPPNSAATSELPETAIAEAELLVELNDCIERLEPADRDLIRWRFFEGQSLRAVAQRLGIAEATARKNRLPAVMARIKRCLRAKGIDDRLFEFSTAQTASSTQ